MTAALHQMAKDALRRAVMSVVRGVLSAVNDAPQAQELQLQLLAGETADAMERFQEYGLTSVPFAGAEAVMVCVGGLRSHGIVIAVEDRRYRLKGLTAGEVALYDDQGQVVHLARSGIQITTTKDVTITAGGDLQASITGNAVISAESVALAETGGPAVARVGDQVTVGGVVGTITSGSTKVTSG